LISKELPMIATLLLLSCAHVKSPDAAHDHSAHHHGDAVEAPAVVEAPVAEAPVAEAPVEEAHGHEAHADPADAAEMWVCPMHPEVTSDGPGTCPTCGMNLVLPSAEEEGEGEGHMARMERVRGELQATLGDAYDAPVPGLDSADAAAGSRLYRRSCETCHGASGKGDGILASGLAMPPADHTDAHHARYYSDAGRMELIRNGIAGTPMVGFSSQLTEQELLDLYAFVSSLRGGEPKAAPHDHSTHAH
jgi:mono/diheme cytochrome c family protein